MTPKAFVGAACAGIFCVAGLAPAQGTGSATGNGGSAATSPHSASSGAKGTTGKSGTASKGSSNEKSGGSMSGAAGGSANRNDATPGTYTPSGAVAPKTTDPQQTKNARDGSPMATGTQGAANAASGNRK